jgi:hypothetical protein
MANRIYEITLSDKCPRCGNNKVRIAIYHFGATYIAECSNCAWGHATGDSEEMVIARLKGKYIEGNKLMQEIFQVKL